MKKHYLCPNFYYSSIYDIDLKNLISLGIKGLIIDLDNTIIPHKIFIVSEELSSWFRNLKEIGFKVCVISNNQAYKVKNISDKLQVPFIYNAIKPFTLSFRKAIKMFDLDKRNVAIIGDQIFTDVLGGKLFGILTILVKPMNPHEHWWTRKLRIIERKLLRKFISEGNL